MRVAGIRVGTVTSVQLRPDTTVLVSFDADRSAVLTTGTQAIVRYLNLTGDRYLELAAAPGSTTILPAQAQIPIERTAPALDLDLLLGGLRPVTQGLNPDDVNALTQSLLQVLQGQGGALQSLLSETSSFTTDLANNDQLVEQLIDNLNTAVGTLAKDGEKFSGTIDRLQQFTSQLAADRDPIGNAITALDKGTASLADLLTHARPPLAATVDELNRLAPNLETQKRPPRRRIAADAAQLSQAGAPGRLRQLLQLLPVRCGSPSHRSRGAHSSLSLDEARNGKVLRQLMLKYLAPQLIRGGFIGVVVIVLVIVVGMRSQQLVSYATEIRYQALFDQAGGLAEGNNVTMSGTSVGTVSSVELHDRQAPVTSLCAVTFRWERKQPPTSAPVRCWDSEC